MRPWQRRDLSSTSPAATELRLPDVVAHRGHRNHRRLRAPLSDRSRRLRGRTVEQMKSGHSRAAPRNLARQASFGHSRHVVQPRVSPLRRTARSMATRRTAHTPGVPADASPPDGAVRFNARSGRWASPPGPDPPPAGIGTAVSPSPLSPVQRADPRGSHGSAPAPAGPERTAGRTATHQEHAYPLPAAHRGRSAASRPTPAHGADAGPERTLPDGAQSARTDNIPAIRTSAP